MKSIEKIKKELSELNEDDYEILDSDEKIVMPSDFITFKHLKCGKEFKMRYINFFGKKEWHMSNRCPYCAHGHKLKTLEEFSKDVYEKVGDEYIVLGNEYKGNKIPIEIFHKKCALSFFVRPDNFLNGTRCPYCKTVSKGEIAISNYLQERNISFKREIWFDKCRDIYPLPFDFALMENEKICCLIEYHGIQHYQPTGKSPFATDSLKKHDSIKEAFCKQNGIPLVIIPYKELKNINLYLENLLLNDYPMVLPHEAQQE